MRGLRRHAISWVSLVVETFATSTVMAASVAALATKAIALILIILVTTGVVVVWSIAPIRMVVHLGHVV